MINKQVDLVLVNRYYEYIVTLRPNVVAKKAEVDFKISRMELPHILWMLIKMKEPDFVNLTNNSHWLGWIQCSLYFHGLIDVKHERDITRDVLKQYS